MGLLPGTALARQQEEPEVPDQPEALGTAEQTGCLVRSLLLNAGEDTAKVK